jgi:hypothetical protein
MDISHDYITDAFKIGTVLLGITGTACYISAGYLFYRFRKNFKLENRQKESKLILESSETTCSKF